MENKEKAVLQEWVCKLSFMQQSVLIASIRGPDTIQKDHVAKLLLRWLRRCVLLSAFEGTVLTDPCSSGGGSFTGPSVKPYNVRPVDSSKSDFTIYWVDELNLILTDYLRSVDKLPHHFQLHFMHAAEILGYKHPEDSIQIWWYRCYRRLVNDMHLNPETQSEMDKRLGDDKENWLAREEVTSEGPK